jgi:DUF4097 and DUF4098 domain-containing protein YvlB
MATMPPPPPGTPPPPGRPPGAPPQYSTPYAGDPRDYWRYQKEQNKAAWRAQRDILRAQNRATRVPSIAGPILLISVGIVAMLLITGQIQGYQFWDWYRRWWPLLLIGIGLVALAEWAMDLRREQPRSRRFGGYVGLVILLVIIGATSSGLHSIGDHWQDQMGDYDEDSPNPFFGFFHAPPHEFDQPVLDTQIPENAQVEIQIAHGDVSVSAGDDAKMQVNAHQVVYAGSDSEAKRKLDTQQAHVTVSGKAVLVKVVGGGDNGHTNLTIKVPASASVNVTSGSGNVTVAGLTGNLDATLHHGNVDAASIKGYVHAHVPHGGDFSAHDVQGDVSVDGDGNALTLSDIHGKVVLQGEYGGDIHLEHVDQSVHFRSERTDLEIARLPGDMSMSMENLHATQVVGPVRIITHSKDIEMSQVYGDTHVEDRNARVELDMAGSYAVEVKNSKGNISVSLPPGAGVVVDGKTRNGDISSDFPLTISGDEDKTITGTIGKGGPRLTLSTEHSDLDLHKGSVPDPLPDLPKLSLDPKAPPAGGVKHLKPTKDNGEDSVVQ